VPVARFQMPDGRIGRFEVPDGTTPEQAQQLIEAQLGNVDTQGGGRPEMAYRDPNEVDPVTGRTRGDMEAELARTQKRPGWRDILSQATREGARAVGMAGKQIAQGALALPGVVTDAPANVYEAMSGNEAPSYTKPYQSFYNALENPLLAERNAVERVAGNVGRAVSGGGSSVAVGNMLSRSAAPVAQGIGNVMQANPGMQVASAVTGAGASGITREAGGGTGAQVAAGLIGGVAPPIVSTGTQLLTNVSKNALRPLTKSGQQQIASDILKSNADDAATAANNLRNATEIIPGSARTTGEASKDIGLLALEKGIRGKNAAEFGQRISEQNSARQAALSKVAGTKADIANAQKARDAATGPMRDAAIANSGTVKVSQVRDTIDSLLTTPAGKRETVSSVLKWAKETIGDEADAAALYEKRKDLQLAMQGKLQPSNKDAPNASTLALARKELKLVVDSLDNEIEAAAPGFKAYLKRYADLSKPIDQKKILQEIQRRSQLQSMDTTTQEQFLGPANFGRAVDSVLMKNEGKLNAQQLQQLNAIRTDLQYGQAINSSLIKAPGSDTFQNLSIAQVIGSGSNPAHPALRVIGKPLQWVYKLGGTDEAVNQLLADAMLDPKLAAKMLDRATPASVNSFASQLVGKARGGALGTAAQSIANQGREKERKDSPSQLQGAGQ
jgi:hypothetical protein